MKMSLLNVSNEVILLLAPHLGCEDEINALCRTTRRFYALLNRILHKRSIAQRNGGYALGWAAINGRVRRRAMAILRVVRC
ncbi:hypothetical protein VN97_g14 [Penicillium thymicola]|uniref:Uncharacterized protein n=1 Tax=Penicillium thymicola TaxID=293382 RepID=A0AAI9TW39_PENTH|nr:hypothetical protein VN97_g14 [Penicillium thymicola]